jgi:hypothetical protein
MPSAWGSRYLAYTALALISGCDRADRSSSTERRVSISQPADSLVVSNPAGVEIWYTLARAGKGSDGATCVERGLEIRRGGERIPVPLLYTGDTPTLLNDSTMRAILWTNCRPVDAYRVDLRNGRPVREPSRSRS